MIQSRPKFVFLVGVILLVLGLLYGCVQQPTAAPTDAPQAVTTQPPAPTATDLPPPAPTATTEPMPTEAPMLKGDAVRGGLLYDKWWEELAIDQPPGDHPLWKTQTTNTRSGGDTWRCKECHGWDYKGAEGAYGSGSHMTGFTGVMHLSGSPAAEILAMMKGSTNPDHDFSTYMDDQALTDIALFISETLIDVDEYLGDEKAANGDADHGMQLYEDTCTRCHGPQGNAINFGDLSETEFVGHIAADNPWEFFHKVRYGQPGWPMPSSIRNEWGDQDVADVLAFAQTVTHDPAVSGGGLLYDKWWTVVGVSVPEGDQPLWSTQSTNTRSGEDTWRCKECHGWDYKGVDGAYGSGSHMTGFKGILASASMSAEDLASWLTGGKNPDHDFSPYMDEVAIQALVSFIQNEVSDPAAIVNADATIVGGDADAGKPLFEATCQECHGEDGKKLNFGDADDPEYVGTIALDNPWEFFHKAAFGQPGEPMPAGAALGYEMQDFADLIAFAQSLPAR